MCSIFRIHIDQGHPFNVPAGSPFLGDPGVRLGTYDLTLVLDLASCGFPMDEYRLAPLPISVLGGFA